MVTFKRHIGIEDYTTPTYWVVYRVFVDGPVTDPKERRGCIKIKHSNLIEPLRNEFKEGTEIYIGYRHGLNEDEIMFMHLSEVSGLINNKNLLSTIHYAGHRQESMLACKGIKLMGLIQINSAYIVAAMQNPKIDVFGAVDIVYTQERQAGLDLSHSKFINNSMCNFMSDNESMAMRSAMLQGGGHDLKYAISIYSVNIMRTSVSFTEVIGNTFELPQGLKGYIDITNSGEIDDGENEDIVEYTVDMTKTEIGYVECISMKHRMVCIKLPEIESGKVTLYGCSGLEFDENNINWEIKLGDSSYSYDIKMGKLNEFKGHITGIGSVSDTVEIKLDILNISSLGMNMFRALSINRLELSDSVKELDNPFNDVIILEFIIGRGVRFIDFSKSYFYTEKMVLPPMESVLSVWSEDVDSYRVDTLVAYYRDLDFICEVFDLEYESYYDIEKLVESDGRSFEFNLENESDKSIRLKRNRSMDDSHKISDLILYYDYDLYMNV